MPTTYIDQAYPVDIAAVSSGDSLVTQSITIVDNNDDGTIEPGDTINGFDVTAVYVGDTVVVDGVLITGATIITTNGPFFTPLDGSVLQNGTAGDTTIVFQSTSIPVNRLGPPCFVKGTLILTPFGNVPVEDLKVGDLITTRDNGNKALCWVGQAKVRGNQQFAPVRIDAGVFGNSEALEVSQQHRMLFSSPLAEMNFETNEVFVSAKHLTGVPGINLAPRKTVDYVHIMFDQHEIVCANGIWAESFYYGEQETTGFSLPCRLELEQIFANDIGIQDGFSETARYCLTAKEARLVPQFLH